MAIKRLSIKSDGIISLHDFDSYEILSLPREKHVGAKYLYLIILICIQTAFITHQYEINLSPTPTHMYTSYVYFPAQYTQIFPADWFPETWLERLDGLTVDPHDYITTPIPPPFHTHNLCYYPFAYEIYSDVFLIHFDHVCLAFRKRITHLAGGGKK